MMKMRRINKIFVAVFIVALLALSVALPVVGSDFGEIKSANNSDIPIATAAAPDGPSTTYGQLASGSTYVITDPNKVTSATVTDDTTRITIDTSIAHGSSAQNPYVIDTEARWNQLVADGASDNNNTAGKFYILNDDIAFSTANQFKAVNYFKGTFYGLRHTFSGLRYTTNSNSVCFSVFNNVSNAVITDLNVTDFVINQTAGSGEVFGGIVAKSGAAKILNCHTDLAVTRTGVNAVGRFGGIMGWCDSTSVIDVLIYKCSSKLNVTVTSSTTNSVPNRIGGILGIDHTTSRLTLWDCYAEVNANVKANSSYYAGSIVGCIMYPRCEAKVEYCAGRFYDASVQAAVGNCTSQPNFMAMSLLSVYASTATELPNLTVRHTYSVGTTTYDNVVHDLYAIITKKEYATNVADSTKTFDEVWSGKNSSKFMYYTAYDTSQSSYPNRQYDVPTQIRSNTCPETELWSKAEAGLPSSIWTNTDVLKNNNYSVDNTPFKSTWITFKYSDDSVIALKDEGGNSIDNPIEYFSSDDEITDLPTIDAPTAGGTPDANRVFVGWTTDKDSSNSKVFAKFSSELSGNVDMYPVWKIKDFDTNLTGATKTDSNVKNTATITYSGDEYNNVVLTANLTTNTALDLGYRTYTWYKDGVKVAGETKSTLTLKNAPQSGKYKVEVTAVAQGDVLWRGEATSDEFEVTINKADVQIRDKSFKIDPTTPPYVGATLSTVNFSATFEDADGQVVLGTAEWYLRNDTITDDNGLTKTVNISFTPTGNFADNYNAMPTLPVTFDAEYITMKFDMSYDIHDIMTINMKYNDNYTADKIVQLFEKEFTKKTSDPATQAQYKSVAHMTPKFDGVSIHNFNKDYNNYTKSVTITVLFEDRDYKVTYDYNDGDPTHKSEQTYKYNQNIVNAPTPTLTGSVLVGWVYETVDPTDSNKTIEVEWNFDTDRVYRDITLKAKWLTLHLTFDSVIVKPNVSAFEALHAIGQGDLIVVAHYTTDSVDTPTVDITLKWGEYTVIYESGAELHVNTPRVKASYTYDGTTKESEYVSLNVNPIKISPIKSGFEDRFPFKDTVAVADEKGTPIVMPAIPSVMLEEHISNYEYVYTNGGVKVDGDITKPGTYGVTAKFTTNNPDYAVDDLNATLTVRRAADKIMVEWGELSFVYNGKPQHPTAILKDESGNIIDYVTFEYEGNVDDAINVGSSYQIKIVLNGDSFSIEGNDTVKFSITKAILPTPTLKPDISIVYDGTTQKFTDFFDGFYPEFMTIESGDTGDVAKNYTAIIKLANMNNCSWIDSVNDTITVKWTIEKAHLTAVWDDDEFIANGQLQRPYITNLIGLASIDIPAVNFVSDSNDFIYTGDTDKKDIGAYHISVSMNDALWTSNYILDLNVDLDYVIVPRAGMDIITVVWSDTQLVFNNKVQAPTYTVFDKDGNDITAQITVELGGDYNVSKWAGNYTVTASVGGNYFIKSGSSCDYTISLNENGEGADPGANNGDGGDKEPGFIDKLLASNFPLWQVAVMAVSAILAIIFIVKAAQYGSKAKQANNEAKKISSRAYASLLPVFSTEVVALGLTNQIWSIMAFAFVGFALLMLVIALINRNRWKKAELAKENAIEESEQRKVRAQKEEREAEKQERIAFQERMVQAGGAGGGADSSLFEQRLLEMEARHREEMERRDEAMKMMLANLMGGRSSGDDGMIYGSLDDTDMLVQRVIAGLLPAVQQMIPEPTAYLTAPNEQNEELLHIVEEQNAQMQAMSEQMNELQAQLASMHEMADAVIMPDNNNDELLAKMEEMQQQIAGLGNQTVSVTYDNSDVAAQIDALQQQIANIESQPAPVAVAYDNSDELKAMTDEMNALRQQVAILSQNQYDSVILDDEDDDETFDDEEEWDSILDEDDDEFVESVVVEADGTVRKVYPNFRMRLKESSDKNREWYAAIKNLFCSQKGVTYRVYKRVEKIRYQGNVIAVIGIAKRSIKLWLALKPYEYDARRYHHKDVSDKPRFVDVPLYVRVGSDRALTRAQELILALFQEQNMEARKRYNYRSIQELIFTLKYNKLLTKKQYKGLMCESIHVHDCDILDDEMAEKCIETKNVDFIDDSVIETVKLDDIDAKFQDGNRVTLERLKKVGLVSEECTGYTVVADKRLTKPLIIVANDFTLPAIKMIALTGGRVIRLAQVTR